MLRLLSIVAGVGAVVSLAWPPAKASRASASAAGLILYWSDDPIPSLWSIRADGSGRHRFLHSRQNGKRPRLSPDRRLVAFDGTPPGKPPLSEFHVQVVGLDGRGLRTLTRSNAWELDAQWLPDGSRVSFTRTPAGGSDYRASEIWTIRPDGSGARRLVRGASGRWSPDGTTLAYAAPSAASDGDVFVARADGASPEQLTATAQLEQPAAWSPDGNRILVTRYDGRRSDVYILDVASRQLRRLTRTGTDVAGAWSPNGRSILFTSGRAGIDRLYLMDASGTHQRPLARTQFRAYEPSWR